MGEVFITAEDILASVSEVLAGLDKDSFDAHCMFQEMATLGAAKWGDTCYKIAIHGAFAGDNPVPHIHIFYLDEKNPINPVFNFEVSLDDIISKGEINLVYQRDVARGLDLAGCNQCSWAGYEDILTGLRSFLEAESDTAIFGRNVTNLQQAIFDWNKETDYALTMNAGVNIYGRYCKDKGITPLPRYAECLWDYEL